MPTTRPCIIFGIFILELSQGKMLSRNWGILGYMRYIEINFIRVVESMVGPQKFFRFPFFYSSGPYSAIDFNTGSEFWRISRAFRFQTSVPQNSLFRPPSEFQASVKISNNQGGGPCYRPVWDRFTKVLAISNIPKLRYETLQQFWKFIHHNKLIRASI